MKSFIKILIIVSFIALFSCNRNFDTYPELPELTTMSDLVVDSEFDWKTTKDIDITLNSNIDKAVYIKSANNELIYQKAFLNSRNTYFSKITIPAYVSEVSLIFNGRTELVSIVDGSLEYTFE